MSATRAWRRIPTPWRIKLAAKLALSRCPMDYRLWQRLGLFRAGAMDDPRYAAEVFAGHLDRAGVGDLGGQTVLELGPGDSLFTAVLAACRGAARSILIDAARRARRDRSAYNALFAHLEDAGHDCSRLKAAESVDAMLRLCRAEYRCEGLTALKRIATGSVDFAFSHAVLEHVPLAEFDETAAQLRRVLKPCGLASHRVDLRDHLAGRLESLRFEPQWWECPRVSQAGFYTNRLRMGAMIERFERAGFQVAWLRVERWAELPTPREALDPIFRQLDDEELRVRGFDVVLRAA